MYTFRKNNVFAACACGDVEILKEMMHNPEININAVDQYHRTGFIIACLCGQDAVVELLLKCAKTKEIDLNWQADDGLTGFHVACLRGHYNVISLIMQHSEQLNINLFLQDFEGKTGFDLFPDIFIECEKEIYLKQF